MSSKYQRIVDKNKVKAKRRVKLPTTIKDFVTNLSVDMKLLQSNLERMDQCRWLIYQSFDSLKQMIRLLQRKKLLGELDEFKADICKGCPFKAKLIEQVMEIYAESTLASEDKDEPMMMIDVESWNTFMDNLKKDES